MGWQFGYDSQDRTTSITDPAGKRTRIDYTDDANGRLRSVTRELPDGGKVTHVFDKRGRRERMIDGACSVDFTYDRSDRLTAVRRDGAPAIVYRYDTLGRIKSVGIGPQFSIGYQYNFHGRLEKITTPVGDVFFHYVGKEDAVVRRLPNGISTRWAYRPDGRLGSITHTAQNNKPLSGFQYTYLLDGLISAIQELTPAGVQVVKYSYDTTKRLVAVSSTPQPTIEYVYDKLGNQTQVRQIGSQPATSQYDWLANGFRSSKQPEDMMNTCQL
jgi:YD repeat-containing protein